MPRIRGVRQIADGAGTGNVVGPGPNVTDRALALFSGTGGLTIAEGTWTNPAVSGDLVPDGDNTRDIGNASNRVAEIRSRFCAGFAETGSPNFTLFAGQGGGVFGDLDDSGGGTNNVRFGGGPYQPTLLAIRSTTGVASATSTVNHYSGGGLMAGAVYSGAINSTGVMESTVTSYGNFTGGYCLPGGGGATAQVINNGSGSFLWAYVEKNGAGTSTARTDGYGAFAQGRVSGSGTHTLRATGVGSFTQGYCGGTGSSSLEATAIGAFAQGRATNGGTISASVAGTFAHGSAIGTGQILASGTGAFAVGAAGIGDTIQASAENSSQFGPGTNSQADSLQVGSAGLRFLGIVGPPTTPQNGDQWVDGSGNVIIRSGGVNVTIA